MLTTILNQLVNIEKQRERLDDLEDDAISELMGMEVGYKDYEAMVNFVSIQSNEIGLYLFKDDEEKHITLPITEFLREG